MDCSNTQNLFTAVSDNDLDHEIKAQFDAHLGECKFCTLEWQHFQATMHCLKSMELIEPPHDLFAGIKQKIDRPHPIIRLLTWLKYANPSFSLPTATATVAVAFACMLLYKNIVLNRQVVEQFPPLSIAGSHNQNSNINSDIAASQPVNQKTFAFRNDLLNSAANQTGQTHWPEKTQHQFFSHNKSLTEPTNEVLFNNYIHRYLKQEFVPAHHSDLLITIHPRDQKSVAQLYRSLLAVKNWQTQSYGQNLFLITLNQKELPDLHKILVEQLQNVPSLPTSLLEQPGQNTILVAISLK